MNDLLKVLDMSEKEQYIWLFGAGIIHHHPTNENQIESLADLSFRLRGEIAVSHDIQWAYAEVYNKAGGYKLRPYETHDPTTIMWIWYATRAKPIHWIIAALIAKEKEDA